MVLLAGAISSAWVYGVRPVYRRISRFSAILFRALVGWCISLDYRLLLQGFPALAVLVAALTLLVMARCTPTLELEARYWEEAREASRTKNFPQALVCYERLAKMTREHKDVHFEWALAAEGAGKWDLCLALLSQLAPQHRQGYGKAHFLVAERLLAGPRQSPQVRAIVESHLLRALNADDVDRDAVHGLLGEICLTKGLFPQAADYLQKAVKTKPQFHVALMEVYTAQGERYAAAGNPNAAQIHFDLARSQAQLAVAFHSSAAKANRNDHDARLKWARATARLLEFPQAIAILEEGFTLAQDPLYRREQARVYAFWFDHLGSKGQGITAERLALLEVGLRIDLDSLVLHERLVGIPSIEQDRQMAPRLGAIAVGLGAAADPRQVMTLLAASMTAESARANLVRLLQGKTSYQVHFTLGVDAWERGQIKEARTHWEEAHKLNPEFPRVANNLAWLLYKTSPTELDQALKLSNRAIELAPQDPRFSDTRGHIFHKMGKFREAVTDLEKALVQSPDNPDLHGLLADVYAQLEMTEIATAHRDLALQKRHNKTLKQP